MSERGSWRREALLFLLALAATVPLRAGEDFAVSGTVRSASGRPLAGVTVSVDEGSLSATTGAAGTFRLRVSAGDHRLRASHPGYGAVARALPVTADVAIDLRLDPVYRLSEEVVVQSIRADARAPVTKKDMDRAEIEQAYYGQEMPYLLKQTPSITQYSDTGMGAGYAYLYLYGPDGVTHLTYNATDNFLVRAAYAKTYGRPDFTNIVPNATITENDVP